MEKFKGVLIASDYDGTLTDDTGSIPEKVRKAIGSFIEQGGAFTVCTGRTKQGFHAWSRDIINAPVLLANGSMAYDYGKQEIVFGDCITFDDAEIIRKLVALYPECCFEMYSDDFRSFAIRPDDITLRHFARQHIEYKEITDISADMFPLVKIMVGAGKYSADFQKTLSGMSLGGMRYIPCTGHFVEIVSRTSGKGSGLLRLAGLLGISPENVYSVGDGANDVDMHLASAHAFVPANGDRAALDVAGTVVCTNNEGALAEVIEILGDKY